MSKRKFRVTVTRVDEYEVEVDEAVWTEEAIKEWESVFYPLHDTEGVAKDLAIQYMRTDNWFIEGYGYVPVLMSDGTRKTIFAGSEDGAKAIPEDKYAKGVSIKPICEDRDYETEIKEI